MRRFLGALLVLALTCCGPKLARNPPSLPTTNASSKALDLEREYSEYLPDYYSMYFGAVYFGGHGRALVDGLRYTPNAPLSLKDSARKLKEGVELPSHLGSGFLFWNDTEFFRSDTFTGPLRPAGKLPRRISRVGIGPSFLLLWSGANEKVLWSVEEQRVIESPYSGLISAATLKDGRSALWLEPHILLVRGPGQKDFVEVKDPNLQVKRIDVIGDDFVIQMANGSSYGVANNGALLPRKLQEPPLNRQRAVAFVDGVPLDGDQALTIDQGVLAKVNLRSGEILAKTTLPWEGVKSGLLFRTPKDTIAVCPLSDHESVVLQGLSRLSPKEERRFLDAVFFVGEAGRLLKVGSCDDTASEFDKSLCIRGDDGEWKDIRLTQRLPLWGDGDSHAAWWIPTRNGQALGIVTGKVQGLYDTKTGSLSPIAKTVEAWNLMPPERYGARINQGLVEFSDGTIGGYTTGGIRHWRRDGTAIDMLDLRDPKFSGPNALVSINERLWQSTDYGQHWQRIHPAPNHSSLSRCSAVGCSFGSWLRLGYPRTAAPRAASLTSVQLGTKTQSSEEVYIPADDAIEYGEHHFGGKGRALVNGIRVAFNEPPGVDVPKTLTGGTELPKRQGGGFLFWNEQDFYRSETFTGPLTGVGHLPVSAKIQKVSFADSVLVMHVDGGGRFAWSPLTGQVGPMPEPGLIDIETLADGRSAKLKEPGELWLRGKGQSQFIRYQEPNFVVQSLDATAQTLTVRERPQRNDYTLDGQGRLSLVPTDPLSEHKPISRDAIFRTGVPIGPRTALAWDGEKFTKFAIDSGQALDSSEPLLNDFHGGCYLMPTPKDVLALCTGAQIRILSDVLSLRPKFERSFPVKSRFFAGSEGTLIKNGPCVAPAKDGVMAACMRDRDGQWKNFELASNVLAVKDFSRVVRWIPRPAAGPLAIVDARPSGIYDTDAQRFTPFPENSAVESLALFGGDLGLPQVFTVLPNETIVGYTRQGTRLWTGQGALVKPSPAYAEQAYAGANALAVDGSGSLVQSTDYGLSWRLVSVPNNIPKRATPRFCSSVGCEFAGWYRVGFPTTTRDVRMKTIEPSKMSRPKLPELECAARGASRHSPKVSIPINSESVYQVDWSRADLPYRPIPVQAQTEVEFNWNKPQPLAARTLMYRHFFGDPRVQKLPLDWNHIRHVRKKEFRWNPTHPDSQGLALPLLTERPGSVGATFLFTRGYETNFGLRLMPNHAVSEPVVWRSTLEEELMSVAENRAGQLYYLRRDRHRMVLQTSGESEPLVIPGYPNDLLPSIRETIALGPDGKPSVLRIWSIVPSTEDDPALILSAGAPPAGLAPWSTLRLGPCDDEPGYRAIVTVKGWLGVVVDDHLTDIATTTILVHWNQNRVCLEAVESLVDSPTIIANEVGPKLQLTATFGKTREGYAFKPGFGLQYVQPLSCKLVKE